MQDQEEAVKKFLAENKYTTLRLFGNQSYFRKKCFQKSFLPPTSSVKWQNSKKNSTQVIGIRDSVHQFIDSFLNSKIL